MYLLEHADISNRTSNSEKLGYNGDVSVLKKNLVLWFRQELPELSATPALIENMVCEAHRKLLPKDLFYPEQFMLRLEIVTGGKRVLTRVQPRWNEDGSPGSVESRYSGPRITSAPQSFPLQQNLSTITLNNPSGESQVDYRVLTKDVSLEIWDAMNIRDQRFEVWGSGGNRLGLEAPDPRGSVLRTDPTAVKHEVYLVKL